MLSCGKCSAVVAVATAKSHVCNSCWCVGADKTAAGAAPSAFVHDGSLHVAKCALSPDDLDRLSLDHSKAFNTLLVLHPLLIRSFQLQLLQPVLLNGRQLALLCSSDGLLPCTAAPFPALSPPSVAIQFIPPTAIVPALRLSIAVSAADWSFQRPVFEQFLRRQLADCCLRSNSNHEIDFFGISITLEIRCEAKPFVDAPTSVFKPAVANTPVKPTVDGSIAALSDSFTSSLSMTSPDDDLSSAIRPLSVDGASNSPIAPMSGSGKKGKSPKLPDHLQPFSDEIVAKLKSAASVELPCFRVDAGTELSLQYLRPDFQLTWHDFRGYDSLKRQVQQVVGFQLHAWGMVARFAGIVLHGPPGVGKSLLARVVASDLERHGVAAHWFDYGCLIDDRPASSADHLDRFSNLLFACHLSPIVIVVDNYRTSAVQRRDSAKSDTPVVALLRRYFDATIPHSSMIVLVTNSLDSVCPSLRESGKFDLEIDVPPPTTADRRSLLEKFVQELITEKIATSVSAECIDEVARQASGFTAADLKLVLKQAAYLAFSSSGLGSDGVVTVRDADMRSASVLVSPSVMRDVRLEVANVTWRDIGGMELVKLQLQQCVHWPLLHPQLFDRLRLLVPRGVLLYGPPGCSKTLVARALATESQLNFFSIKGPELFNKWLGESERAIRELFRKARCAAPAVVFFDEIDAVASKRDNAAQSASAEQRVLAQLLTEMDGLEALHNVIVVAATNRPDMLDPAVLRPGRFDRLLFVDLPDVASRRSILQIRLEHVPCAADVSLDSLAAATDGFSGAEVVALCQEASFNALHRDPTPQVLVTDADFNAALRVVKPRTDPDMLRRLRLFSDKFSAH